MSFSQGRPLVIIFFLALPGPGHKRIDVTHVVHYWLGTDPEAASRPSHGILSLVYVDRGPSIGTQVSLSHCGSHSSSVSSDHLRAQGTSQSQSPASAAQGADVNNRSESSEENALRINSVSISRARSELNTERHVSTVLLQLLNSILCRGGADRSEVPRVLVASTFGSQGVSPGCEILRDMMEMASSALLPSMCRQRPQEVETIDAHPTRLSSLLPEGIILVQYNLTSVLCSSDPNGSAVHLPRERDFSPGQDTLSLIKQVSAEPVQETPEISQNQTNRQFRKYPFWSRLFNSLVHDQSSGEKQQPEVLKNENTVVLYPVIREIMFLIMLLMTIVFRYLPRALGAHKTNKYNNAVYLKVLSKSFFIKWTWGAGEGHRKSSTVGPVDRGIGQESHRSPGWKRPQLDILNSYIFRPWLTKATSRQRQPCPGSCCSSTSSLCSSCQRHFNNFMANAQRTIQVSPAFLPDPTGNRGRDLAHVGYRLATLAAVPASCSVSRVRLSDAGFYSLGREDEVICYSCKARHSGWQTEDNPIDVHRRLSPACQHVLQKDRELADLGLQSAGSVSHNAPVSAHGQAHEGGPSQGLPRSLDEDSELSGTSASTATATSTTNTAAGSETRRSSPDESRTSGALAPTSTTRTTGVPPSGEATAAARPPMFPRATLDLGGAVYPAYNSIDGRRRTFTQWNDSQAPPLNQILLSGMFYAGYQDCVRCFYCGVGLKTWVVTDNVWDEHVRWRPECGYLRAIKGDHFIRQTQRRLGIEPSTQDESGAPPPPPPPPPSGNGGNGSQPSPSAPGQRQQQPSSSSPSSSSRHPPSSSSSSTTTTTTTTGGTSINGTAAPSSTEPSGSTTTSSLEATSSAGTAATAVASSSSSSAATTTSTARGSASDPSGSQGAQGRGSGGGGVVVSNANEERASVAHLRQENAELSRRLQCRVCRRLPVDIVLLPCGHLVVCESCSGSVTSCPLCHGAVTATIKVIQDPPPP